MYRTALARTHRPRRFGELVGQDHVASTLRAAVEGDRVGHAYLFCGPRGIGKTTAARILAMALNCPEREDGEPCGTCESCERIWSGRTSLDVVEIDAASNRGVDDARDLRERAMYAPSDDERYKVYILDEAHMLTREAWNALLKILEEPPPRVIFAFATTEPQKIQQTAAPVLSRCQRFDFRRVSVPDIVSRLETVLEAEGATAEEGALLPIARRAEGGVRDALSLLDQVLSFAADRVRVEDVRRMLGLVEEERYLEFFDLAARGDRAGVFPFVQELVDAGHDPVEFVRGLADALRMLLVLRVDGEADPVEMTARSRERFSEMAGRFGEVDLLRLLVTVSEFETSSRFRRSAQQRIQLEVLLLRLVSMDSAVELEDLLRSAGGELEETGRRGSDRGGASTPAGESGAPPGGERSAAPPPEPEAAGRSATAPGTSEPGEGPTASEGPTAGDGPTARGDRGANGLAGGGSPREIWRRALEEIEDVAAVAKLRMATLREVDDGTLHLETHEGFRDDLRSFLDDPARSAPLRTALARHLPTGEDEMAFRLGGGGRSDRMTARRAREQRLEELMQMDPKLRSAVEELDLTIEE